MGGSDFCEDLRTQEVSFDLRPEGQEVTDFPVLHS